MELTAAQRQVVEHPHGRVRVAGAAGTGKTTSLVQRHHRLARDVGGDRVLVLCRDRAAADRFRDAAIPVLRGGVDALPVTTFHGFAFDVVTRHAGPVRLLTSTEHWGLVRELLAADAGDHQRWPRLHELVHRPAFVDEVAGALLHRRAALVDAGDLHARATAAGVADRWEELEAFGARYAGELARRGVVDSSGLLARAVALLAEPEVAAVVGDRFRAVLVDDFETATATTSTLLASLTSVVDDIAVAGNPEVAVGRTSGADAAHFQTFDAELDVTLEVPFRQPDPPRLVHCGHPSLEPEAIAGVLLQARAAGVRWGRMAVLVRRPRERARAITRALTRHGIPVAPTDVDVADEPAVRAIVDLLRWMAGDGDALERLLVSPLARLDPATVRAVRRRARAAGHRLDDEPELADLVALRDAVGARRAAGDDVATLAHEVYRLGLVHLVDADAVGPVDPARDPALDAVVAFLDGLTEQVERDPALDLLTFLERLDAPDPALDPWRPRRARVDDAVTVDAIAAAAGREWHTVVVAGCLEGELPRVEGRVRFFDRALLDGHDAPAVAVRRRQSLDEERRLFALGCSRATGTIVGTAAPEPGVLTSRFVARWPAVDPAPPLAGAAAPPPLEPTPGAAPMWPDGRLALSASQLDTFADCPLRYAYRYGLRVREEAGVHADFGSLVHAILAEFLDPDRAGEHSLEHLRAIAARHWRDDIARYQPQREEARRDLQAILELWWEHEGGPLRPDVLAVERRFEVTVGPHVVTGAIDRVDRADDGRGIRVVDYKTGKREPRPHEMAENLQLATYHLAASRDERLAALGTPTQLRLLFLRTMHAHELAVADGLEATTEAHILDVAARILAEEREPSVDADCDHCDFHRLCPLWPEGREVAAS